MPEKTMIDAIRQVNAISLPSHRPHHLKPRLAAESLSGTIVMRAGDVTIGYPGKALFTARSIELRRGECAALIGPNGSGKTTFLKTMLEQVPPLRGKIQLGGSLKIGYFAQAHDGISGDHTVIEELVRHKPMQAEAARSIEADVYVTDAQGEATLLDLLADGARI